MPLSLMFLDTQSQTLDCAHYELSFTLITEITDRAQLDQQKIKQNISFTKLLTLIEAVVDQSLVIDAEAQTFQDIAVFNNNVIVLPEATEAMLTMALHNKFNTVVDPDTYVDCVRLKNTTDGVSYEYVHTDKDHSDMPTIAEWLGELSYWESPWWLRPDISTLDRCAQSQEEHDKWQRTRAEAGIDELNSRAFTDIENEITVMFTKDQPESLREKDGEVIEVDFLNKNHRTDRKKPS